jgi:hypothetical protein
MLSSTPSSSSRSAAPPPFRRVAPTTAQKKLFNAARTFPAVCEKRRVQLTAAPRASAPQALGMDEKTAEAILVADPRLNAVLQSLPLSVEMPTDGVDPRAEAANAQVSMPFLF